MQELEKILEEIESEHPYKVPGNYDSYSQYNEAWSDAIDRVRARLENYFKEKENDGWIPVGERLPKRTLDEKMNKSYKKYLVFIDSVDGWDIDIAVYDFWNDKKWREAHDGYGEIENVIAWRPLPEPYRPERSNDEKE